jgi:adenylate cyclase
MVTKRRKSFTLSVFLLLAAALSLLTFTSAGVMLVIGQYRINSLTNDLIDEKSELVRNEIVESITRQFGAVELQARYLADVLANRGNLSVTDPSLRPVIKASLAAVPQVATIALVNRQLKLLRVFREDRLDVSPVEDWSDDARFANAIASDWVRFQPEWGSLFFSEHSDTAFFNYVQPVDGGKHLLLLSVSILNFSEYLHDLGTAVSANAFVLYGDAYVFAHRTLAQVFPGLSDEQPLPSLHQFPDAVLRHIWSTRRVASLEQRFGSELEARVVTFADEQYVFLYRPLVDFGPVPLFAGTYIPLQTIAPQLHENYVVLLIGGTLIAANLLMALLMARAISRPIRKFTAAAQQIADLNFDSNLDLPRGRISEVKELTRAFDSMIAGLKSFERYVPARLAERIVGNQASADTSVENRTISIMFADIVGFTSMSEAMPPQELLAALNEYFEFTSACIEAEAGTIDKFIGDSVMAFWGGLDADRDHAVHACAAALRIEEAVGEHNRLHSPSGRPPLRVRIGIHTGRAMVGNIGSEARISYTIIGDSVNIAARLEEFSRTVDDPSEETVTIVSGETASALGTAFNIRLIGEFLLRGRHSKTVVYRLLSHASSP